MSWTQMIAAYTSQDRDIFSQPLPLTAEEHLALALRLEGDSAQEKMTYNYNHFTDNCATRLRDHIDAVDSRRQIEDGAPPVGRSLQSYRDLIREHLSEEWMLLSLSELFLGRHIDRPLEKREAMFLPAVLSREWDSVDSNLRGQIYVRQGPRQEGRSPTRGQEILLLLGILITVWTSLTTLSGSEKLAKIGLGSTGAVYGGLGTLLCLSAVISPLPVLRYNELLLVFLPTDMILLSLRSRIRNWYLITRLIGLVGVGALSVSHILIQPMYAPLTMVAGWTMTALLADHINSSNA